MFKKYNFLNIPYLQYWLMSKYGEIRRDEMCIDYAGGDVFLFPCHGSKGNQLWFYKPEVRFELLLRTATQNILT